MPSLLALVTFGGATLIEMTLIANASKEGNIASIIAYKLRQRTRAFIEQNPQRLGAVISSQATASRVTKFFLMFVIFWSHFVALLKDSTFDVTIFFVTADSRHDQNPRFSQNLSRLEKFYTRLTPVISCLLTVNTMLLTQ